MMITDQQSHKMTATQLPDTTSVAGSPFFVSPILVKTISLLWFSLSTTLVQKEPRSLSLLPGRYGNSAKILLRGLALTFCMSKQGWHVT